MTSERTILIIPTSFDEDIKRRLEIEEIISFLNSLDLTTKREEDIEVEDLIKSLPQRVPDWTSIEVNYLLYGHETLDGLVCTGNYFHFYNFFHYIDTRDPKQATREDLCEADGGAPHIHTLVYNPEENNNKESNFLGTLHNHPHLGFPSRKRMDSINAVGFSPEDKWWNNYYLEKYGNDGRKLAFVVYYSDNDFYMGAFGTKSTQPELLEIMVK